MSRKIKSKYENGEYKRREYDYQNERYMEYMAYNER